MTMTETRNILVVRGSCGLELAALAGLRDYVLESLRLGAVVLDDSATLEVMELPPLLEVEVAVTATSAAEPLRSKEHTAPPPTLTPREAEKQAILARLKAYRDEHGLGCWREVAKASGGKMTEDILRDLISGQIKMPISAWRLAGRGLDKLEAGDFNPCSHCGE